MKILIPIVLFQVVVYVASSTVGLNHCKKEKLSACQKREEREQHNLNLVLKFYDEAFGQHDVSAVDRYVSDNYSQHNPQVPDGPQGLKDFLVPFNANKKKGPVDIRHTTVTGDVVWLHVKTTGFKGEPLAIVDIFRIENGKIEEHWDVIQAIPPLSESKNQHPMF